MDADQMISLAQWRSLEAGAQIDMWLAAPEAERAVYIAAAHPVAAIVLRCIPAFTGDLAGDRLTIKQALECGDWLKDGLIIAEMRDNEDRLNAFVEATRIVDIAKMNWQQGLEESVLEMWPAAQLISTTGKMKPGTQDRWVAAGGKLYSGKMIALKISDVWSRFSIFGRAYPPYDNFSHALDVEDVERDEAEALGLL